jgi:CMP-N-acetylneuraminic acid synthetase
MPPPPTILAVIPARGGSKRVPRKNVRPLAGLPLIVHAFNAARLCTRLSRLIVSTDDDEIAALAAAHGVEVPFRRPEALATDDARAADVAVHALETVLQPDGRPYDVLVWLQPTCPLRRAEDIDATVNLLVTTDADSAFTVCPSDSSNPSYWYLLDGDRPRPLLDALDPAVRSRKPSDFFLRNGAVYAVRASVMLATRSFYGASSRAHCMPADRSVNIDTETDFALAEVLLARAKDHP